MQSTSSTQSRRRITLQSAAAAEPDQRDRLIDLLALGIERWLASLALTDGGAVDFAPGVSVHGDASSERERGR